jgi:hemolysin activation/secretion protein
MVMLSFERSMNHKVNDPFQKLATAGILARFAVLAFAVNGAFLLNANAQMDEPPPLEEVVKAIDAGRPETFYIREFRIVGAKKLPQDDVDAAVYNRLGKGRTPEDVEGARVALEKAYHDKGYQTVSVTVPPQSVTSGVIVMQVSEVTVGRLSVKGSRFFDIEKIKKMAPSLAEGNVPNFNDIQQDIMGLNQQADCQVTPSLTAGKIPGTVDVELTVKDKFPLHGSVEINNRYSANTTPLRLDAAVRYDNLWQWGHTIGGAFQVAPQRPSDALIYSGYYIARTPSINWLSLMLSATRQNSEVSTLGGSSSLGNGEIYGGKFLVNLPSKKGFYHSASLGLDYKDFAQDLVVNDQIVSSPLTYWPFSLNYNASSIGKHYQTEFNAGVTFAFRGTGTEEAIDFDNRRYNASANFFYLRGGIEHTQKLAWDFQLVGGLQGQATANPLVDTEQFSLGGLSTVRGYLESSVVGDNAVCGTLELRTPSLLGWLPEGNEWRFFAFIDAGYAMLNDPLPEQVDHFTLWSIGVGTSLRLIEHVNGEFLIGIPQVTQSPSQAGQPLFTFRVSLEL